MPRTVAMALDESEWSEKTLQWYIDNLCKEDDMVLVLNARPFNAIPSGSMAFGAVASGVWDSLDKELTTASEALLKKFGHKLTEKSIKHRLLMIKGDARESIVDTVSEEKADLLIMGNRGLGAVKRAFVGSVSDYCVHHCHCPVIVVKH